MNSDQSRTERDALALFMDYCARSFLGTNFRREPVDGHDPQKEPQVRYGHFHMTFEESNMQAAFYATVVKPPLVHVETAEAFTELCKTFAESLREHYEARGGLAQ